MDMHNMGDMHNTFWHEDQLVLTFHSHIPLISERVIQGGLILGELGIEEKLPLLNSYLKQNGVNNTLSFLGLIERVNVSVDEKEGPNITPRPGFSPRTGISMFDVSNSSIKPTYGEVNTSIVGIFNFTSNQGKVVPNQVVSNEQMDQGDENGQHSKFGPVVRAVNLIHQHLEELNNGLQLADGSVLQISVSAC